MGQRVGANQRQYHRIKKLLLEDKVPQDQIAKMFNITPQSLEKICAHLEGREERVLVIEENPEVARLRAENAAFRAKLGIEAEDDGTDAQFETSSLEEDDEEEESSRAESA